MKPSKLSTEKSWIVPSDSSHIIFAGTTPIAPHELFTAYFNEHVVSQELSVEENIDPTFESAIRNVEEVWRETESVKKYAKPVQCATMMNASGFLKVLSNHTTNLPEISAFPDGEIEFAWETDKGSLSVLVDEHSLYFFSKSRTGRRRKGNESWASVIPMEVLEALNNLY